MKKYFWTIVKCIAILSLFIGGMFYYHGGLYAGIRVGGAIFIACTMWTIVVYSVDMIGEYDE